ncbi:MAG: hypothetical protein P4L99_28600, partial [Chthoniobacter sp.]|nr:hypothetical protein [Chthoniobacter sp.]
VLGCIHRWLQPRPHLIADQFSLRDFAHPKLPSSFAQRVQIIREHCLVQFRKRPGRNAGRFAFGQ